MTEFESPTPVVLIVDDDRSTRGLLNLAMSAEGYRVVEAKDGEQGLTEFRISQPDIVLMDAMMPGMDGFTCCQQLRQLPGGDRVPLLILTVLDDQDSVDRAFAAGATEYITKPIHWPVLSERVRRLLTAHRALITAEATCDRLQRWTQLLSQTIRQQDQPLWQQLQTLVQALRAISPAERIHLWQQNTEQWVESTAIQPAIAQPHQLDLTGVSDWNHTLQQGQLLTLHLSDIEAAQNLDQLADTLKTLQTNSLLVLPLLLNQQLWGTLYLHSPALTWPEADIESLLDLKALLELIIFKQEQ